MLLCGVSRELVARLARAGFAVLSVDSRTPEDVGMVLDALKGGALSVEGDERVAVVAADEALGRAAAERGVPWCGASGATDEQSVETIVRWLARHLV